MKRIIAFIAYVVIATIGWAMAETYFQSEWNKVFIMGYGYLVFHLGFKIKDTIEEIKL